MGNATVTEVQRRTVLQLAAGWATAGSATLDSVAAIAPTPSGILGGVISVEERRIPARNFSGMGLRMLDVEPKLWADYWVNGKSGVLTPTVPRRAWCQGVCIFAGASVRSEQVGTAAKSIELWLHPDVGLQVSSQIRCLDRGRTGPRAGGNSQVHGPIGAGSWAGVESSLTATTWLQFDATETWLAATTHSPHSPIARQPTLVPYRQHGDDTLVQVIEQGIGEAGQDIASDAIGIDRP